MLFKLPGYGTLILSKGDFTSGLQCLKRLYLHKHHPDLQGVELETGASRRITGQRIGALGRRLIPNGTLISAPIGGLEEAVIATETAISQGESTLYEAAFVAQGLGCRADILTQASGDVWDLIEVKSSSRVKPEQIHDVAFQVYVGRLAGFEFDTISLATVDTTDAWNGEELSAESFFEVTDVTDQVNKRIAKVEGQILEMQEVLKAAEAPAIETNNFCTTPVRCPFYDHCHQGQSPADVENLPGIHAKQVTIFRAAGIRTIEQIPARDLKSAIQLRAHRAVTCGQLMLEPQLGATLQAVRYPAAFLDFEAVSSPFPLFVGTRPYETVPFQWSCHFLDGPNEPPRHLEFLGVPGQDPRAEFLVTLERALGGVESVVFYSSYELSTLNQLSQRGYAVAGELHRLLQSRGVDLLAVIKANVYMLEFEGSFSIKSVLPAKMGGQVSYANLAIQDGSAATNEYVRMLSPATSPQEQATIRTNLLEYCKLDTLAMVLLLQRLQELS